MIQRDTGRRRPPARQGDRPGTGPSLTDLGGNAVNTLTLVLQPRGTGRFLLLIHPVWATLLRQPQQSYYSTNDIHTQQHFATPGGPIRLVRRPRSAQEGAGGNSYSLSGPQSTLSPGNRLRGKLRSNGSSIMAWRQVPEVTDEMRPDTGTGPQAPEAERTLPHRARPGPTCL